MAEPAAAERATGYVTGGISPLGHRSRLPVVLDASARDWADRVRQRRPARPAGLARPGRPGPRRRGHRRPDRRALAPVRRTVRTNGAPAAGPTTFGLQADGTGGAPALTCTAT